VDKTGVKHIVSDDDEEGKKLLADPSYEKMCTLEVIIIIQLSKDRIYKSFICDNLPNGYTNEALP
jgi:hypothetical protein